MRDTITKKEYFISLCIIGLILLVVSGFINVYIEKYFPSNRECLVNVDVSNPQNVRITSNCEVTKNFTLPDGTVTK